MPLYRLHRRQPDSKPVTPRAGRDDHSVERLERLEIFYRMILDQRYAQFRANGTERRNDFPRIDDRIAGIEASADEAGGPDMGTERKHIARLERFGRDAERRLMRGAGFQNLPVFG